MGENFLNYDQSLSIKELGFDEPCLAWYVSKEHGLELGKVTQSDLLRDAVIAPLKQQALHWFRDNYGLYHHIWPEFYTTAINFNWQILWYLPKEDWTKYVISEGTGQYGDNGEFPSYKQAEEACIDKIIELIKKNSYGLYKN